jgi:hypothetical protein
LYPKYIQKGYIEKEKNTFSEKCKIIIVTNNSNIFYILEHYELKLQLQRVF